MEISPSPNIIFSCTLFSFSMAPFGPVGRALYSPEPIQKEIEYTLTSERTKKV